MPLHTTIEGLGYLAVFAGCATIPPAALLAWNWSKRRALARKQAILERDRVRLRLTSLEDLLSPPPALFPGCAIESDSLRFPRPSFLQLCDRLAKLERAHAEVSKVGSVHNLAGVNSSGDLQNSHKVDIEGLHVGPEVALERDVQVASPLRRSQVDRSGDDPAIEFSTPLPRAIKPGDPGRDPCADDHAGETNHRNPAAIHSSVSSASGSSSECCHSDKFAAGAGQVHVEVTLKPKIYPVPVEIRIGERDGQFFLTRWFHGQINESYRPFSREEVTVAVLALLNGFLPPRDLRRSDLPERAA